jgi:hypothetical protein
MSGVSDKSKTFVPIDCPICEFMIRDSRDVSSYYNNKCCVDCWIGFLEPIRKLKRDEEYLPTGSEIKSYRNRVSSLTKLGE